MRNTLLFILLLSTLFSNGQSDSLLWILPDHKYGDNIIVRPSEYIDGELNQSSFFVRCEEDEVVVSPVNGAVLNCCFRYFKSLKEVITVSYDPKLDKEDLEEYLSDVSLDLGINKKYLTLSIAIKSDTKGVFYINGLKPMCKIISGQRLQQGDTLGLAGYVYPKIVHSAISVCRSLSSVPVDPLEPFGISCSFRGTVDQKVVMLSPHELKDDLSKFKSGLLLGHPGLFDYGSKLYFDSLFRELEKEVNGYMTPEDFMKVLIPVIAEIRDSHTSISLLGATSGDTYFPEIFFGWLEDDLVVTRIIGTQTDLIGKRITKINGVDAAFIYEVLKNYVVGYDGFIESYCKRRMLLMGWDYYRKYFDSSDTLHITFEDGSSRIVRYVKYTKDNCLIKQPSWKDYYLTNRMGLQLENLDDNIAYMGLHTFDLDRRQRKEVEAFFEGLVSGETKNLIIDLRNNPGGSEEVLEEIFAYVAMEPFRLAIKKEIKPLRSNGFFELTANYKGVDPVEFESFCNLGGEENLILPDELISYVKPHTQISFVGNVFLITNAKTQSAASVFASLVQKHNRGVVVGRETGSAYYQINAVKRACIRLENSGIECEIPLVKSIFDSSENCDIEWGRGVIPNFMVPLSLEELDYSQGDVLLEFTLSIVNSHSSSK